MLCDCEKVLALLPQTQGSSEGLPKKEAAHLASCLKCQAHASQYASIASSLALMRRQVVPIDEGHMASVLEEYETLADVIPLNPRRRRLRKAISTGRAVTAVTAAAATVVAVKLLTKQRLAS